MTAFVWRLGQQDGEEVGAAEAARLAELAAEGMPSEAASWEAFMNLVRRLQKVEEGALSLDRALDKLLADIR